MDVHIKNSDDKKFFKVSRLLERIFTGGGINMTRMTENVCKPSKDVHKKLLGCRCCWVLKWEALLVNLKINFDVHSVPAEIVDNSRGRTSFSDICLDFKLEIWSFYWIFIKNFIFHSQKITFHQSSNSMRPLTLIFDPFGIINNFVDPLGHCSHCYRSISVKQPFNLFPVMPIQGTSILFMLAAN